MRTDPRQLLPLLFVLHLFLNLVDTLQGFKTLIQQEGGVINQHVNVAHKLLTRAKGQKPRQKLQVGQAEIDQLKTKLVKK